MRRVGRVGKEWSASLADPPDLPDLLSRRTFLAAALLAPAALRQPARGGARYVGDVPLSGPGGAAPPYGRLLGDGLDARLFTDLSKLGDSGSAIHNPQSALLTPNERFFVRTAAPSTLPPADAWTIRVGGLVRSPIDLALRDLESLVAPPARVLLECSGNADPTNYGLLSAADWQGAPLAAILDRARPTDVSARVLVSGVDDNSRAWRTSVAGASWIFTRDDLRQAFLAVRMNSEPLPRHHGAPVRLVVPGWYGCACIKWVDRIDLVPDDAPATSQMREFAARTHQRFVTGGAADSAAAAPPALARDYVPAVVDTAAMPVRVEQWTVDGRAEYRITGIVWGGTKPTNALSIRFRAGGAWTRLEHCPLPQSTLTWSLWTHTWRPTEPGRYQIVLRVDDPSIRTRRLDVFFYVREIEISDV